ncbi:MAG: CDP-alcohol phosphatidyltransferase family protein [Aquificaceae bacterium]|nr:CDP-alcohol phosphatidyltransferase family protein [Aquificaceae bacterium]MCX8060429.1 CDP-alcohol phosphatidyltransferase family protein [Aquificaceae bacterium]MDW8097082.1 CDP-alcohol phosphatidyltransferase family protein [Aquificaceae bacterium]
MSYIVRELKPAFERLAEPVVSFLQRLGATPNTVTLTGFLLVVCGSVFLYYGNYPASFFLLLGGGLADALDGSLARRMGRSSPFGAFLDSLVDRVSDALPFVALALSWQDTELSLLALMALLFSYTVSYARARAEGLGYELKVGLFERTERWILLLAGLLLNVLPLAVALIALGSFITTLQRVYTFRKLARR